MAIGYLLLERRRSARRAAQCACRSSGGDDRARAGDRCGRRASCSPSAQPARSSCWPSGCLQPVVMPGRSAVRTAGAAVIAASVATEIVLLPIAAALFGRVTAAGPILNLVAVPAMTVLQQAGLVAVVCDRWWPALAAPPVTSRRPPPMRWSNRRAWWTGFLPSRNGCPLPTGGRLASISPRARRCSPASRRNERRGRWRRRLRRAGGAAIAAGRRSWILLCPARLALALDRRRLAHRHQHRRRAGRRDADRVSGRDDDAGRCRRPWRSRPIRHGRASCRAGDVGAAHRLARRAAADPRRPRSHRRRSDHRRRLQAATVRGHCRALASADRRTLRALARARRLDVQSLYRADALASRAVAVRVWHPPPPDWERRKVRNDDSVVIELRMGDVSIVLPGDIGADVERELAGPAGSRSVPRAQGRPPRQRQLQLGARFSMPLRPSSRADQLRPPESFRASGAGGARTLSRTGRSRCSAPTRTARSRCGPTAGRLT